jgi:hypothetical protein
MEPSAVREDRDAGTVWEELPASRPQRDELPAVPEERDSETVARQPFGHVAAVDQTELEQAKRSAAANGQRTGVEASRDSAADAEVDDHPDPQPQPHMTNAERPGRQQNERRMVPGGSARWGNGSDMKYALRAGSDPNPLRTHPKPVRGAVSGSHPRLSAQRTGEPGPRDVDEQSAASGVPDDDRGCRRSSQLHAEWARTEPNAAAGRGTGNGCRGGYENKCRESASHLPITVNVSVAA